MQRIADVLDVRFRFPRLWEAFLGGELRWWQAVDVTNRAAVAGSAARLGDEGLVVAADSQAH